MSFVAIILIMFTIFLLAGGVYDLMENPIRVLPTPSNPVFWFTGMSDQTLNESAYFMVFLAIGICGGYIVYRSSSLVYRQREVRMLLIIGVTMMVIATICCEVVMMWKGII
jgi:hypothetical protein